MPHDLIPLRLQPGDDLRPALEAWTRRERIAAAFVVSGIGSLRDPALRFAGAPQPTVLAGEWEITSLGGSLSPDGAHLHAVVSGADGRVFGGHVAAGCLRIHPTA
jgi:predicted DNA-binding protein with PD1-like motif